MIWEGSEVSRRADVTPARLVNALRADGDCQPEAPPSTRKLARPSGRLRPGWPPRPNPKSYNDRASCPPLQLENLRAPRGARDPCGLRVPTRKVTTAELPARLSNSKTCAPPGAPAPRVASASQPEKLQRPSFLPAPPTRKLARPRGACAPCGLRVPTRKVTTAELSARPSNSKTCAPPGAPAPRVASASQPEKLPISLPAPSHSVGRAGEGGRSSLSSHQPEALHHWVPAKRVGREYRAGRALSASARDQQKGPPPPLHPRIGPQDASRSERGADATVKAKGAHRSHFEERNSSDPWVGRGPPLRPSRPIPRRGVCP